MSRFVLTVLLLVCLAHFNTNAVRHGFAPDWILQKYCSGRNELIRLPWRCDGYLLCRSVGLEISGAWFKCDGTLQFNEQISSCVPYSVGCDDFSSLTANLCASDPTLKFPHQSNCAMFYDCSQTQRLDQYNLGVYENECPFPQLFDPDTGTCRAESAANPVICDNKPTTKCDYRKECLSTPNECLGKRDGLYRKPGSPPFSADYITCTQGKLAAARCGTGAVFDPVVGSCSVAISASLRTFCMLNPKAVFPDAWNCAKYYNCSLAFSYTGFNPFQAECLYRNLFDIGRMSCALHSELTTPCGSRFEPIDPCEYKVGQCIGRTYCIPCAARCKGKVDGPYPYPNYPNTKFHITCKGGRLLEVLKCPDNQIYFEKHQRCLEEGSTHIVGKTTTPPVPTTTPPVESRVTDPPSGTCGCLGTINPMLNSLSNLTSFVDTIYNEFKVPSPHDCDQPPLLINGKVELSYESEEAVASYSCNDGYELCQSVKQLMCRGNNSWDTLSLGQCVKNQWPDKDGVELTCNLRTYSEIKFWGRAVEDDFEFEFFDEKGLQKWLYVRVLSKEGKIMAGPSETSLETVESPISLVGKLTWRIRLSVWKGALNFEIYVNDVYVMSVDRSFLTIVTGFSIVGGFRTENIHILYEGSKESPFIRPLSSNLAYLKPVFASSEEGPADANRITDGFAFQSWRDNSCWSVESGDASPWIVIDLLKEFYVSNLVLSTLECVDEICPKGLQNVIVSLSNTDPRESTGEINLCANARGEFLNSSSEMVICKRGVSGRYVKMAFDGPYDKQITLCEVEVYGGLATQSEWSPFSCPDPPLVESASVSLSYTHNEAVATYLCDESYHMCLGNHVIHCHNETGWYASPGVCRKAEHHAGPGIVLDDIHVCPLRLGSALELWLTPTDDFELRFTQGPFVWLGLVVLPTKTEIVYDRFGDTMVTLSPPMFVKNKEIRLVLYSLTDHVLIEIDDEFYYQIKSDHLYFDEEIKFNAVAVDVKKVVYHPSLSEALKREVLDRNLAFESGRFVSSTFSTENNIDKAVDGDLGTCWIAKPSDEEQFILLDLGAEYFIREVKVLPKLPTDDKNWAIGKTASGSANVDGNSNAGYAVDGVLKSLPSEGSCFSTLSDSFWMVDLGQSVSVSSVAIQTRSDGNDNEHSQIIVNVYASNPFANAGANALLCFEYNSTLPPFERISCESPQIGQYVKIEKIAGAESSALTLCEVEVYSTPESHQYDFSVDVFSTSIERGYPIRCGHHEGDFPNGPITLTCSGHTAGRYVVLQADRIAENDQMNICNIEVHGDQVVKNEWSSEECRFPPLVSNAFANVSYSPMKAQATYTCFDGHYACQGTNTIYCTTESLWEEPTVVCKRENDTVSNGVSTVSFCPLEIGDSVEFFFTPTDIESSIEMKDLIMEIAEPGLLVSADFKSVLISPSPLIIDKESKIVITVFGDHLLVDIDGSTFKWQMWEHWGQIHEIKTAIGQLRRYLIKRWNEEVVEYHAINSNQALEQQVYGSSSLGDSNPHSVVDGNLDYRWESMSCWSADIGDTRQSFSVFLGKQIYMTHVTLTSSDCPSCEHDLHDFKILAFVGEGSPETCFDYHGTFPPSSTKTFHCRKLLYADLIKIEAPDRKEANDLLTLCEVQVFGGDLFRKDSKRNIALFQRASSVGVSEKNFSPLARDGVKAISLESNSCFKSSDPINNPWWEVRLDDHYYINQVAITTIDDCGEKCEVKDFAIDVGVMVLEALCLKYDDKLPFGKTTLLTCDKRIPGNKLRITMFGTAKVLHLCEVEVYGDRIIFEETGNENVAVNRPVFASSRQSPPSWAADGNLDRDLGSCWTSEIGDEIPWWTVELDGVYLVHKVELTNLEECGEPCNQRLSGFVIDGFLQKPKLNEVGQLCAEHPDAVPHSTSEMIECISPVVSRYMRLITSKRENIIHICEFKVFGRKTITSHAWPPSKCPEPPSIPNACVDVCYHDERAVATYTCNTNYSMCTGSNTLTCSSEAGWEGSPGTCVQTTMEVNAGHEANILDLQVCHPQLGEGFEMWVTPELQGKALIHVCGITANKLMTSSRSLTVGDAHEHLNYNVEIYDLTTGNQALLNKSTLEFLNDHMQQKAMKIIFQPNDVAIEMEFDGEDNLQAFSLKKESHLVIVYVSAGILVIVDGKTVTIVPHVPMSTQIGYIRARDGFVIRKIRPLERYSQFIERVAVDDKLAAASVSASAGSPAANVNDGDMSLTAGKCWYPNAGIADQWIEIGLDHFSFVREVALHMTSDPCECADDRTHDFRITLHSTRDADDRPMTCAFYEGTMPLGAVERVACRDDVWGRFLRITKDQANVQSETDVLTFCEIEVYGDKIMRKEWTADDCPRAPDHNNAYAQILSRSKEKVAMYTCEENFSMCGSNAQNKLKCNSETGWQGDLEECVQTTRELNFGSGQDLGEFRICPFALGEGVKIWFTSTGDSWREIAFSLATETRNELSVVLDPERVQLSTWIVKDQSTVSNNEDTFLTLDKEAVLSVYFLSESLLIFIDGTFVTDYPHTMQTPLIDFVISASDVKIRKVMQSSDLPSAVATASDLIGDGGSINGVSSTADKYNPDFIFDGIPGSGPKCWMPNPEVSQWVLVDLGQYAFITKVDIFGKKENLALGKTATGSSNYDDKSDPKNAVDGSYDSNRINGDCYTTTVADPNKRFVVDLGKTYIVDAIAVQGRTDSASNNDQADDIVINLYQTNPITDSTANATKCKEIVGRPMPFTPYACDSPVEGRYVEVTRPGATEPMTLCEVQVFSKQAVLGNDIKVEVLKVDDLKKPKSLCGIYEVDKGLNEYESIVCKERIWGRYLYITKTGSGQPDDVMSICDIRVLGDSLRRNLT